MKIAVLLLALLLVSVPAGAIPMVNLISATETPSGGWDLTLQADGMGFGMFQFGSSGTYGHLFEYPYHSTGFLVGDGVGSFVSENWHLENAWLGALGGRIDGAGSRSRLRWTSHLSQLPSDGRLHLGFYDLRPVPGTTWDGWLWLYQFNLEFDGTDFSATGGEVKTPGFIPYPEPSTFMLLAAGLGAVVGTGYLRRRAV